MRDPLTGQPFPNNTIPSNRIDPYATGIINLVPPPNQSGANNYYRAPDLIDNSDRLLVRLDLRPTANDTIFARYIWSNRDRQIPGAFGGVVDGTGTSAFGNQTIKTNGVEMGWTRILSPSLVNEFRFSWTQATRTLSTRPSVWLRRRRRPSPARSPTRWWPGASRASRSTEVEVKSYSGFGMAIGQQADDNDPVPIFLHNQGSGTLKLSLSAKDPDECFALSFTSRPARITSRSALAGRFGN